MSSQDWRNLFLMKINFQAVKKGIGFDLRSAIWKLLLMYSGKLGLFFWWTSMVGAGPNISLWQSIQCWMNGNPLCFFPSLWYLKPSTLDFHTSCLQHLALLMLSHFTYQEMHDYHITLLYFVPFLILLVSLESGTVHPAFPRHLLRSLKDEAWEALW